MINCQKINEVISGTLIAADTSLLFSNVASPSMASETDVVFLFDNKININEINAKLIVTKREVEEFKFIQILHPNPRLAMAKLLQYFHPSMNTDLSHHVHESAVMGENVNLDNPVQISPSVVIGTNVSIGKNTYIGPNTSIGKNCKIGKNCIIHANVSIYNDCVIGDNVIIHSNSTIGADGFGYEKQNQQWLKIPQISNVIIMNDVEIGSQTSIDRGCLSSTVIESGVKVDNQVQISHNCIIGADSIIVSGSLIGGSSKIGKRCILAGNANVSDNVTIEDDVTVLACSGVTKNIKSNQVVSGFPAIPHREEIRFRAFLKQLFRSKN